jgi:hypothetical protein
MNLMSGIKLYLRWLNISSSHTLSVSLLTIKKIKYRLCKWYFNNIGQTNCKSEIDSATISETHLRHNSLGCIHQSKKQNLQCTDKEIQKQNKIDWEVIKCTRKKYNFWLGFWFMEEVWREKWPFSYQHWVRIGWKGRDSRWARIIIKTTQCACLSSAKFLNRNNFV